MTVKPIPEGYRTVTPYLIVEGAETLIDFLQRGFAAEETSRVLRPDGCIMHAEVKIGDSLIMLGEAKDGMKAMPSMIHLYVENADAAYDSALKAGGTSIMQPKDEFYGDRAAGVKDPTGNCWWIATHQEDLSPEEMEQRLKNLFGGKEAV